MLYIISIAIDYIHTLCFLYTQCLRERVAINMQGTMFTLAKLKIVPSDHQELVLHPMPEHIEALS